MERAAIVTQNGGMIRKSDTMLRFSSATDSHSFHAAKTRAVARFEISYIKARLCASGGNITRAAKAAGKNRRAFWELIRKHGVDATAYRTRAS